jgi:hypothetical protein
MLLSKSDGGGPAHEQAGSPGYLSRPDPGRHSSARAGVECSREVALEQSAFHEMPVIEGRPQQKQFVVPRLQVSMSKDQLKQMPEFKARPLQPSTTGVAPAVPINWPSAPRSDRRPAFQAAG